MTRPHFFQQLNIALLTTALTVFAAADLRAANQGDAWDQLKDQLKDQAVDHTAMLKNVFGSNVSPSQAFSIMKVVEAAMDGDWKNVGDGIGSLIIGKFSGAAGGYLNLLKACAVATDAVIQNWGEDLYRHPSYTTLLHQVNATIMNGYRSGTPYLPSYMCSSDAAMKSRMQAIEGMMFQNWKSQAKHEISLLLYDNKEGYAARLRQQLGFSPTEQQVFNHFLTVIIRDQRKHVLTVAKQATLRKGMREAMQKISTNFRRYYNRPPSNLKLSLLSNASPAGTLQAGTAFSFKCGFQVIPGTKQSYYIRIEDSHGRIVSKSGKPETVARTGPQEGVINFPGLKDGGSYKASLFICRNQLACATTEVSFMIAGEKDQSKNITRLADLHKRMMVYYHERKALSDRARAYTPAIKRLIPFINAESRALEADKQNLSADALHAKWEASGRRISLNQKISEYNTKWNERRALGAAAGKEFTKAMTNTEFDAYLAGIRQLAMTIKNALDGNDVGKAEEAANSSQLSKKFGY